MGKITTFAHTIDVEAPKKKTMIKHKIVIKNTHKKVEERVKKLNLMRTYHRGNVQHTEEEKKHKNRM